MVFRYGSLILVLCGALQSALAEEQATAGKKVQDAPSRARIALEIRQPILSDKFLRLLREHRKLRELPAIGDGDVFGQKETAVLLSAAANDRRGDKNQAELTLQMADGDECKWALVGPRCKLDGDDLVKASLSDDGQTIELLLTWAHWKENGEEYLPAMKARIPLDSHLVLHIGSLAEKKQDASMIPLPSLDSLPPLQELDDFADRLIGAPRTKASSHQRFLVISPSIVETEDYRSAKK